MLSCLRGRTYIPSLDVAKEIHRIRGVVDGCYNDPIFTEDLLLLVDCIVCDRTVIWRRVDGVCVEGEQVVDDKEGSDKDKCK